ncbi:MAG: peptidoglycan-associated lipoprotein Pal [Candidatus Rokuibacteriota bacterium]
MHRTLQRHLARPRRDLPSPLDRRPEHRLRRSSCRSTRSRTSTSTYRYDIRPADTPVLDENARWMKANPRSVILIEGHADERGTNEYNLALGERRAKAAMNYLVAQGVPANRITVISYGEERPLCTERTEDCWARNRRVHFLVKPR